MYSQSLRPTRLATAIFLPILLLSILWFWETSQATASQPQAPNFITFESGPVTPLARTSSRLIVTNIPDNRIEVFTIEPDGQLTFEKAIPVGLEPVAIAVRDDNEVWVVNHLSDSVSVVDLDAGIVTRTLLVGDEPRGIVFGGADNERAFIATAHRGQHRSHPSLRGVDGAGDPQFTEPGIGRTDVWVFDANNLGDTLGGTPLKIVELFGDTPRALAVTPDGNTVYAAVFNSGNQTAIVPFTLVCKHQELDLPCDTNDGITSPNGLANGQMPGGPLPPFDNAYGDTAPPVSLIVKYDPVSGEWRDEQGRNWSNGVRFFLPDYDVFAIDTTTLEETNNFSGVGTTLFNMVVNPVSGNLYVSNTEANNMVRFEGDGVYGGSTVQGNLARSQITVIDPLSSTVQTRQLNKHIDYDILPAPEGVKEHSLATPLDMIVSADGETLFVAAYGSSKVGIFDTAALEADSFDPTIDSANYINVSGGGPSGLILNEDHDRLYVYTRFDNAISVIDTANGAEISHLTMHNPEPEQVIQGRRLLYDAYNTSSNGEASCASCHPFGDMDHIAWDLGNPDEEVSYNPMVIIFEPDARETAEEFSLNGTQHVRDFHPNKGPMLTQSLRGISTAGALHWRGDKAVGPFGEAISDERTSFKNFIGAFNAVLGDTTLQTSTIRTSEMDQFADFALALTYPPNPVRALDNSLTISETLGLEFYRSDHRIVGSPEWVDEIEGRQMGANCARCHRLQPINGFYGADGQATFEELAQIFKAPQLRNLYTRIGKFGVPANRLFTPVDTPRNSYEHMGDQVRGYGFGPDGIYDTLYRFMLADVFNETGYEETGFQSDADRRNMEAFMWAFDTDLAPITGQQITIDATNQESMVERLDLLIARAEAPFKSHILGGEAFECDLVVLGTNWGALYDRETSLFEFDSSQDSAISKDTFLQLFIEKDESATFMCVPFGSGLRMGLDRDGDGFYNGDELLAETDPADPTSFPVPNAVELMGVAIGRNTLPFTLLTLFALTLTTLVFVRVRQR